jgi:hypothetical protein
MFKSVCLPCLALLGAATLLTAPALAQNNQTKSKSDGPRSIPIKRALQFYDVYLGLPPQDRDGLKLSYKLSGAQGAPRLPMNYVLGNTRIPIELSPNGTLLNLPNAALFNDGTIEVPAGQGRMSVGLDIEPVIPLSRSMTIAAVTNPLNDYSAATRRAGPLAVLAPRLSAIRFVGGTGGQVEFNDGRRMALPAAREGGGVIFTPSDRAMRDAKIITFATPPTSAEYAR